MVLFELNLNQRIHLLNEFPKVEVVIREQQTIFPLPATNCSVMRIQ